VNVVEYIAMTDGNAIYYKKLKYGVLLDINEAIACTRTWNPIRMLKEPISIKIEFDGINPNGTTNDNVNDIPQFWVLIVNFWMNKTTTHKKSHIDFTFYPDVGLCTFHFEWSDDGLCTFHFEWSGDGLCTFHFEWSDDSYKTIDVKDYE
jgi:hypothetical protein